MMNFYDELVSGTFVLMGIKEGWMTGVQDGMVWITNTSR